ncbi:uncharacterized protein LOC129917959 [Episyrphus balteatus]|uniref:uncharacterized protein LOC129917959 n=1 Tax=Episyrphus balteatus TaxID=286459 RepID=UPI002486CCFC|nr:uncharacterized protein LOC129917959 [Episyrphus balteatus]
MEEFSSDELNPPSWMDDQFFEDVLRKCERTDKISIENVEITPATVKGDHFASVMFRAVVAFNLNQSKSMIIKIMPQEEGCKQDFLKESFVFETEIGMYSKTIPKFEEELRKVGDNTVLGPKALYWSLEPQKILILEDICLKGYKVIKDRMATMEESKIAFLKLAKWHAVSYKLSNEVGKLDLNILSFDILMKVR